MIGVLPVRSVLRRPKLSRALIVMAALFLLAGVGRTEANERYAAYVIDANTNEVLYSRNADEPRYPASVTKVMTLYIVFEELVEGGLTRYVAVWHSDIPEEIGPVRSIRPMDPDIVSPFGGIIAYSGGQYRFVVLMQQTNVYNAIHGAADTADLMYRTTSKTSPHNVLVAAETLVDRHLDIASPAQQFAFAPDVASSSAVVEGTPATGLTARFSDASSPSWKYDESSETWKRSQLSGVDRDSNGDQLSAANVLVMTVPIAYGLGVSKTEMIGGGDAWVFAGGQSLAVRWSKASQAAPIILTDLNGVVVRLAPGNTWIELMPTTGALTIDAPSGS